MDIFLNFLLSIIILVIAVFLYKTYSLSKNYKQKIEELKEREERLNYFYNAIMDGIVLHEQGKPLLINHSLENITGFSYEELMNMRVNQIISIKPAKSNPSKLKLFETFAYKKDGSTFPVEVEENFVEYKGREVKATVVRDISKRKEVENALKQERIKRLSTLFDGQEIERQRLSRELHDGLGQQLIAIKLRLESTVNASFARTVNTVNEVKVLFNNLINEVKQISTDLMPPLLKDFAMEVVLENLCNSVTKSSKINVSFEADGDFSSLEKNQRIYIYRIAQEGLNNIVKYSEASSANVFVLEKNDFFQMIIEDNGKGFNFNENYKSTGNGIYNMRERTNLMNGKFNLTSAVGKGTAITVRFPIKNK